MATYATVKGNTAPALVITLRRKRQSDGKKLPIDLTLADKVELKIKNPVTKTITNTGHQETTILDAEGGQVAYQVADTDFPGTKDKLEYPAEAKITWEDGKVETVYEQIIIVVRLPE